MKLKNSLKGAKNIGVTIEKRLNEIGIFSLVDLVEMTPERAYQKICKYHPEKTIPVCYYLYSFQGALFDLHWNDLPTDLKNELLEKVGQK